jgi:hypothetical protein
LAIALGGAAGFFGSIFLIGADTLRALAGAWLGFFTGASFRVAAIPLAALPELCGRRLLLAALSRDVIVPSGGPFARA